MIGIGGVAQPVAEKIKGKYGNDDVDYRQHQPRVKRHNVDILRLVKQNTPTCHRRPKSETEEGQSRLT